MTESKTHPDKTHQAISPSAPLNYHDPMGTNTRVTAQNPENHHWILNQHHRTKTQKLTNPMLHHLELFWNHHQALWKNSNVILFIKNSTCPTMFLRSFYVEVPGLQLMKQKMGTNQIKSISINNSCILCIILSYIEVQIEHFAWVWTTYFFNITRLSSW